MIVIEGVELSRSSVGTGETLRLSVAIVTHGYLGFSTNSQLSSYTYRELTERGVDFNTHEELTEWRHSELKGKSHRKVKTMSAENGGDT